VPITPLIASSLSRPRALSYDTESDHPNAIGYISGPGADTVLPGILAVLPAPWGGRIGRFTLVDAAHQVTALHPATNLFAPALSLVVLLAWPALALLAAALTITRRDA
jgi:hypothetical protein